MKTKNSLGFNICILAAMCILALLFQYLPFVSLIGGIIPSVLIFFAALFICRKNQKGVPVLLGAMVSSVLPLLLSMLLSIGNISCTGLFFDIAQLIRVFAYGCVFVLVYRLLSQKKIGIVTVTNGLVVFLFSFLYSILAARQEKVLTQMFEALSNTGSLFDYINIFSVVDSPMYRILTLLCGILFYGMIFYLGVRMVLDSRKEQQ